MLTANQKALAADLLTIRPAVLPGTRVVASELKRASWYRIVGAVAATCGLHGGENTKEFMDLAGVPD